MEGQPTVEVCAVTSSTPSPGQTVTALVSTQDVTATGMCMVANVNETHSCNDFTTFFCTLYAAGMDYSQLLNVALMFTSTSPQRQCIIIFIEDDQSVEPLEQFIVQLVQTTQQGQLTSQASVFITDSKPLLLLFSHKTVILFTRVNVCSHR